MPLACTDDLPSCEDPTFDNLQIGRAAPSSPALYVVAEQNQWHEAYLFKCNNEQKDDCFVATVDLRSLWDLAIKEATANTASLTPLAQTDIAPSFDSIHLSKNNGSLLVQTAVRIYQVPIVLTSYFGFNYRQPLSPFVPTVPNSGLKHSFEISLLVQDAQVVYGSPGNRDWLVYLNTSNVLCAKYIGAFQNVVGDSDPSFCFSDTPKELRPVALGQDYIAALDEVEGSDQSLFRYDKGTMYLLSFPTVSISTEGQLVIERQSPARKLSDTPKNYEKAIFAQNKTISSQENGENSTSTTDRQLILSTAKEITIFDIDNKSTNDPKNTLKRTFLQGSILSGGEAFGEIDGLSAISPSHNFLLYKSAYNGVVIHHLQGENTNDVCVIRHGDNISEKKIMTAAGWAEDGSIFLQSKLYKRGGKDRYRISRYKHLQSDKKFLYDRETHVLLSAVPLSGSGTSQQPWAIAKVDHKNTPQALVPPSTQLNDSFTVDDNCLNWPLYSTILDMRGKSLDVANLYQPADEEGYTSKNEFRLKITRKASPLAPKCSRNVNLVDSLTGLPFAFANLRRSDSTKLCISASNLLWTSICKTLPDEKSEGWGGTNNNGADHQKATSGSGLTKTSSDKNSGDGPTQ